MSRSLSTRNRYPSVASAYLSDESFGTRSTCRNEFSQECQPDGQRQGEPAPELRVQHYFGVRRRPVARTSNQPGERAAPDKWSLQFFGYPLLKNVRVHRKQTHCHQFGTRGFFKPSPKSEEGAFQNLPWPYPRFFLQFAVSAVGGQFGQGKRGTALKIPGFQSPRSTGRQLASAVQIMHPLVDDEKFSVARESHARGTDHIYEP